MNKPRASIVVVGRRWRDRHNGNTYFSAAIVVDGRVLHTIGYEYGYGDQYLDSAFDWLDEQGFTSRKRYPSGCREAPRRYCEERSIALHHEVVDVARKRDLHGS